ncbi:IclR family transcriptional regulator C-terminal domain-containing protein [Cryobacterium sp.]|jgi:IclR family pca regulon transcriptional regulator|uniref:IclR family transcriptional regulator domain-containing protein n=1 Tax=Cryobacterium sp. TaxID=1926290 RepID=UPI00263085B6|nr:IclR family transcriptional regulator C-terminal domain-containing protein [Cryobacterium sp.]MCU1445353.1 transcriptional regulator, IclR family [Cryobacterium sp.]
MSQRAAPGAPATETSTDFVQSLARGLGVITAFSGARREMTLTEVAGHTDLTRATARRFLRTLEQLGYVRTDGKLFSLTAKVLELGYSYLSSLGLPDVVTPHLRELSSEVQESASAAILDGNDVVYVARSAGRKIMQVNITVGTRFPAYATSMGRVLLAALPDPEAAAVLAASSPRALTPYTKTAAADLLAELHRVRLQGYSLVEQELEVGLRSLAVPVRTPDGRVVAAVNVSTSAGTPVADTVQALLPALTRTAQHTEADLALGIRI